jgi:hypothetical protein
MQILYQAEKNFGFAQGCLSGVIFWGIPGRPAASCLPPEPAGAMLR